MKAVAASKQTKKRLAGITPPTFLQLSAPGSGSCAERQSKTKKAAVHLPVSIDEYRYQRRTADSIVRRLGASVRRERGSHY